MIWTWEMQKNNLKSISSSACSPLVICRWHQFLSLPSARFHVTTNVKFSCGSIFAFVQVTVRGRVIQGFKLKSQWGAGEDICNINLWLWWLAGGSGALVLMLEKIRLSIFLAYVKGSAYLGSLWGEFSNSNFLPFTEFPKACQNICILWGVFAQRSDSGWKSM